MVLEFFIALISFLILDALWLGFVMKSFYKEALGVLIKTSPNLFFALITYLILIFGIVNFVIPKAENSIFKALLFGALFGLVVYGVYDFTNLAVIKDYPLKLAVVDWIWGMVVCGLVSSITVYFLKLFGKL